MNWNKLNACDVIWPSPSADAAGSMPLGNGDIGVNLWVEPNGDLVFYLAKTDAWDHAARLLAELPAGAAGAEAKATR